MEGRVVGRGWTARLLHVSAQGRALPLAWRVRQGPTGQVPAALHLAMVALLRTCIPAGATVVWLGDGAGASTALQATRNEAGWSSVPQVR